MPVIDREGLDIYYEEFGQGRPLLLIHGLGSSSRDWELQIPEFEQHFRVIAMDLRGHGRSAKPPGPYSMRQFAGDAVQVLRAVGAVPAQVLGISLGGMVAFQLALDHPDLLDKLVIVNSVPELRPRNLADRLAFWQRLLIIRLSGMEKMGEVLAERFLPRPEQKALREIFVRRWSENDKAAYLASLKSAFGWSIQERLDEIKAPTLVIGAEEDYFPTALKRDYTGLMPDATLIVVPDSRHALPAEKPDEFNRLVLDFLTSRDTAGS
jgi:3-oxoadipate enol-lactonase